MDLIWHERVFDGLTPRELYAIVALRERVFVVEQACAYQDADGLDLVSRHLWAERAGAILPPHRGAMLRGPAEPGLAIAAYLRIVPAGAKFAETSIGRVIVAPERRGTGLGRTLMQRGLAAAGPGPIRLGAQAHLERFYGGLGFQRASEVYDEDGIPHIEMLRPA